ETVGAAAVPPPLPASATRIPPPSPQRNLLAPSSTAGVSSGGDAGSGGLLAPPVDTIRCPGSPVQLQRLALKILSCSLDDLTQEAKADFEAWLAGMNISLRHMVARNGCIHLVADVVVVAAAAAAAATAAATATTTATAAAASSSCCCCADDKALQLPPGAVSAAVKNPTTSVASDGGDEEWIPRAAAAADVVATTGEASTLAAGGRCAGDAIVDLLYKLLGPNVSKLGGDSVDDRRSRLILQLDDQVVCWSLLRCRDGGNGSHQKEVAPSTSSDTAVGIIDGLAGEGVLDSSGGCRGGCGATVTATGVAAPSGLFTGLVCGLPRMMTPAAAVKLTALFPVAILVGQPAHVQVAVRFPAAAEDADGTTISSPFT
ncbi:hypothetical protein Vretimale_17789, partial [Volvox reticuliferus]